MDFGNHWHKKIKTFLKKIDSDNWTWVLNSKYKYLNIRVDTRNGNFLIFDQNKNRVDEEQVLWQYSKEKPTPPKSVHYKRD